MVHPPLTLANNDQMSPNPQDLSLMRGRSTVKDLLVNWFVPMLWGVTDYFEQLKYMVPPHTFVK